MPETLQYLLNTGAPLNHIHPFISIVGKRQGPFPIKQPPGGFSVNLHVVLVQPEREDIKVLRSQGLVGSPLFLNTDLRSGVYIFWPYECLYWYNGIELRT